MLRMAMVSKITMIKLEKENKESLLAMETWKNYHPIQVHHVATFFTKTLSGLFFLYKSLSQI